MPPHAALIRIAVALWLIVLAAVFAFPAIAPSSDVGDDLIRNTVRLALVYYAAAVLLMLTRDDARLTRWLWTLACLAYVIHVAVAFHFYHGWSHAHAVEHVRRRSGVGEGIWVSHLFTLCWCLDVLAWWVLPAERATRPAWLGWTVHGFMTFVIFNGTVVYETGPVQWGGGIFFTVAAVLLVRRLVAHPTQA